ncbi:hypothetical protein phD2B_0018 [Lelliottia phage phD2B]|uniref:Uncharacterized protein n=1 Tax=Lelliottia phage phD2B TaxID=1542498 RepID=A0A097P476_9CAUD|nr:hypothetical protein phD2B_0018 [Lelliottia phage phD2B]AIU37929.1 hypothetical protein phD2B_0018 [Lelliottia phage phD2B]
MKVQAITLHFKPGVTSLGGTQAVSFNECGTYPDLHYIVREGQHIVNYTDRHSGERVGVSLPASDIRQVNTRL